MPMNNLEMMQALEQARQKKLARVKEKLASPPPAPEPPVDWKQRKLQKNRMFRRWLSLLGVMSLFSLCCVVLPLLVVHPPLGKTTLLAMPPNLFITLSWMAGAWYTFDKNRQLGMILTVGMTPVRFAFFAAWIWLATYVPGLDVKVLLLAMMIFWGLFTVPEIGMLVSFTRKLQRTSLLEPRVGEPV